LAKKPIVMTTGNQFAGWISEKFGIAWVVSEHRHDKRTGVIK